MQIESGQMVFLIGHRGAVSHEINCVMLELSIALNPEDAKSRKGEKIVVAIPADYAPKVISSLEVSLARLRQTN